MDNKLYVGNLSHSTTEDELREAFAAYGEVASVTIITDRETGHSRGFGFVEMSTEDGAAAAIDALNGTELSERTVKVETARAR